MFKKLRNLRQVHPYITFSAGTAFLGVAALLVSVHVQTISEVTHVSVPLVAKLPQLERRAKVLHQQVELTQLQATRTGSQQEKVEVYALPEETDISRLIATFEVMRDALATRGLLSDMSDLTISEPVENEDGSTVRTVSVEFTVHEDGMKTINLLVRLAGLLSVGDALSDEERELLVDRIEQESPTGIIALEQFLSIDLLRYIEEPKTFEKQLEKSFTSQTFHTTFNHVLRTSVLYDAKVLLGDGVGHTLKTYKLWPLQMMAVDEISLTPGSAPKWYKMGLTVSVFSA